MLSILGWLNGLTALFVVIFGCCFGLFFIYKSKKSDARLLKYCGLMIIISSLLYLGPFTDFLVILVSGSNMDNSLGQYGILSYVWLAPGIMLMMYIGAELMIPQKKWYFLFIILILSIMFELFVLIYTLETFTFTIPKTSGSDIIDSSFIRGSPAYILIIVFVLLIIFFNGFGCLYRSIQSTGLIRRKFFYLSLGFFIYPISGIFDTLFSPGIILFIVRLIMISSFWFWYFGLREEHLKDKKIILETKYIDEASEITLIDTLIAARPSEITEDEVTLYREQKICLVCKGKLDGFVYMCSNCEALYCVNCGKALANLENICWVCNTPVDKSKPVKSLKQKDDQEKFDISKKR